jgi:hypothetical protein
MLFPSNLFLFSNDNNNIKLIIENKMGIIQLLLKKKHLIELNLNY